MISNDAGFTYVEDVASRQVLVSLQSTEIAAGNYTAEVWETDLNSGYVAKTFLMVEVSEPVSTYVGIEIDNEVDYEVEVVEIQDATTDEKLSEN